MDTLDFARDFRQWIPIRIYQQGEEDWVDWCHRGEHRFTAPFFHQDVGTLLRHPFNQAFRRQTPLSDLLTWAGQCPGIPLRLLVYHASRCGSTLLAGLYSALPDYVVHSEPVPWDGLIRALDGATDVPPAQAARLLQAMASALGQPGPNGESSLVIKCDAWHILSHDLIAQAFPHTPALFLYRDPVEILVSQMTQRGSFMVPGYLPENLTGLPGEAARTMDHSEFCARLLGRIFAGALSAADRHSLLLVNYRELPQAAWSRIRDHAGLSLSAEAEASMWAAALPHAKQRDQTFVDDSADKQAKADPRLRALAEEWVMPHYRALEARRLASLAPKP